MGSRNYAYQYGTSPRKLKSEYDTPKKRSPKKLKKTNTSMKKVKIKSKKVQEKLKAQESRVAQINFTFIMVISLGCILLMMYRSVKINEAFNEVQSLSKSVQSIEKENSQISVNIQNNFNLSNIESIATSTLGMQKLSSKQTMYITLDTKDYTEVSSKQVAPEQKDGFWKSLFKKIGNWF